MDAFIKATDDLSAATTKLLRSATIMDGPFAAYLSKTKQARDKVAAAREALQEHRDTHEC
jgi:hypothetical protein